MRLQGGAVGILKTPKPGALQLGFWMSELQGGAI